MSGHPEVNAQALGPPAHDPTPEQLRRAGVTTVQYCLANRIPYAEMVELLQAVGVIPAPSGGKTTAIGKNISPDAQEKNRVRNAAGKRAARNRKKAS